MRAKYFLMVMVAGYLAIIFPFTAYLQTRPTINKIGYLPDAEILKLTIGDQRYVVSEWAVFKVMLYFGAMYEEGKNQLKLPTEYPNMARTLATAVKLDPYNMDAYYLAQAAFVWDVKGAAGEVNNLLIYGMKYRTWDFYLPFFAGFNAAYFLHDFKSAADYMKKAAELSGDQLFANLAARYFYEAGTTELGIIFIDAMEKGATDEKVKKSFRVRKEALLAVRQISEAVERYRLSRGNNPASLQELVSGGFMRSVPKDPYGGRFYLAENGKVRTTSKFAFGGQEQ